MSTAANPQAPKVHPSDAAQESTGAVASDSLAAESIKADGAFAENDNAAISSVKGANSTLNTTDTSGASVLQPATDGAERARNEAKGLGSDEKGTTGVKYPEGAGDVQFDGVHSAEGYVGGPAGSGSGTGTGTGTSTSSGTADVKSAFSGASGDSFADGAGPTTSGETGSSATKTAGVSSGAEAAQKATTTTSTTASSSSSAGNTSGTSSSSAGASGSSGSNAADAPNYAATVSGALRPEGEAQPKGTNLTEGGIPETKTFTGDVGGQHDPSRAAEQDFQKVAAGSAASAGEIQHEGGAGQLTGGKFDVLESERA